MRSEGLCSQLNPEGEDFRGRQFNRLTVVGFVAIRRWPGGKQMPYWRCQCSCGGVADVAQLMLTSGTIKSCGCLRHEEAGVLRRRHGMSVKTGVHPIYRAWSAMLSRCNNPNDAGWRNYGGRKIKVEDPRWSVFENFRNDMLPTWKAGFSLERKNNEAGYSRANCEWATSKKQSNNKRNNHPVAIGGVTKTISQWCEVHGINRATVFTRIHVMGWDPVEAILTPVVYSRRPRRVSV